MGGAASKRRKYTKTETNREMSMRAKSGTYCQRKPRQKTGEPQYLVLAACFLCSLIAAALARYRLIYYTQNTLENGHTLPTKI